MTDKQIIIDGIDVSGCKYFANNKCLMLCATGTACDVYPYCYYKALKRKEQECERLKQTLAEIKEIAETFLTHCMGWRCDAMDDILQKISEVEDG